MHIHVHLFFVPRTGIEPAHCCQYQILSLTRLPVPPSGPVKKTDAILRIWRMSTKLNAGDMISLPMITIGLLREGKIPADNRVALTPAQCKWIHKNSDELKIVVQSSVHRCFSDKEYLQAGVDVREDMHDCDILLGIKEVPSASLIPDKTYLFFSHTKKMQPHNRQMSQEIIEKRITLIDYECMEHEDGQRILGFGFFAGVVGAHNGIMAFGKRTGAYDLQRVYIQNSFR